MGPLRSGPKGGTDGVGQYKNPGMRDSIRAHAREACFSIEFRQISLGRFTISPQRNTLSQTANA